MKAYKGFNADMTCRGFQYKEGETYHEDIADLCHKGFHACERPLDVLEYYSPNSSVYHEVELDDVSEQREEDSKVCAKFIKIGAKVDITTLVEATVDYTVSKCDPVKSQHAKKNRGAASATGWNGAASATGDKGAASAIGDKGAASATGDWSVASATGRRGVASATGRRGAASATGGRGIVSATGDYSVASATGDWSVASATGFRGAASATGDWSVASATGFQGVASATGFRGAASATGCRGAASATGDWSVASATGFQGVASATGCRGAASANNPTAIAVAWGPFGRAKGVLGAHIVCAEWRNGKLVEAKMAVVDGDKIKADTYYMLKNGEFAELEQ